MLPWKWKLYRIVNYLLLVSGAIISVRFLELSIRFPYRLFSFITAMVFIFLVAQSLINLVILAKHFPDKALNGARNRWHFLALVLNSISLAFLAYGCFSLLEEIGAAPDHNGLWLLLIIMITLLASMIFVLICQFTVKKYLQMNNSALINTMLDSIGKDA